MQDENTLREVAKDCVHCGFCLPACPTYQLWAEEMDSPRGRIYLVNQILDGAPLTATAAEHFDRCLGCMACMTACPSGVQYDQLIEAARVWTEEARSAAPTADAGPADAGPADAGPAATAPRRARDRAARAAIFSLFPYPGRLRALTAPLRAVQRTGLDRRLARSSLPGRVSPVLGAPQQPCPRGMITSQPSAASTRAVEAFTCGKNTDCTHPVSMPTTARRVPSAGTRSGSGRTEAPALGASRSAAPSTGETRSGRLDRASRRSSPVRCAARSGAVSARSRLGYGNTEKMAARATRSRTVRPGVAASAAGAEDRASSVHTRAASMSWSYCTPEGQAVMQAMQPRQRSKCSAAEADIGAPSRIWFTR